MWNQLHTISSLAAYSVSLVLRRIILMVYFQFCLIWLRLILTSFVQLHVFWNAASVPVISENEAREALLEYCDKKCCYGKGAARSMNIRTMQSTSAFHVCSTSSPNSVLDAILYNFWIVDGFSFSSLIHSNKVAPYFCGSSSFLAFTIAPYVDISLHGGHFWARSTSTTSFSVRL